ncbi:hypothetical protein H0E87_019045 [Populus deltoides]|uniref:Wall-associated receptor kinase galacturonan-binding domain-containing protein n=1 Tax=Populus deltoides TaxID=3696 RepID=A0A8T2XUK9_POPDE|nr:hypothetical protein H0E87_019045 [Populus deltoides]
MIRRQESPVPSTTLFSVLIFILSTEVEARFIPHGCSRSSCGDIEIIDYPFRLKTDPPGCGETVFQLSCENNKTILEFHSGKYYVKQISYDDNRLRVVDFNLASGSCSLPYKSVSVDEGLILNGLLSAGIHHLAMIVTNQVIIFPLGLQLSR